MAETLKDKILRHVHEGQFDPNTLLRGVGVAAGHFVARNEDQGRLRAPRVINGYLGIPDLTVARYKYVIPQVKGADFPWLQTLAEGISPEIRVYDFPRGSELRIMTTAENAPQVSTRRFIECVPDAIATVTGPTARMPERAPNNGFFLKSEGDVVPFSDTNPSGQRRGAMVVTEGGKMVLVNDDLKWGLVRSGYPEVALVSGTSTYLTRADLDSDLYAQMRIGKRQSSFLMHYVDAHEQLRMAFAISKNISSRLTMKQVMDHYVDRQGGLGYFAVEMELAGSECVVRGPKRTEAYGGGGFGDRRDHYVVVPATERGSTSDELYDVLSEVMMPQLLERSNRS